MVTPESLTLEDLLDICRLKYKTPNPEFVRLLKDLFSSTNSGLVSDEAFHNLMHRANEFSDELLTVFQPIRNELAAYDHSVGNWYYLAFLECLSMTSKGFPILYEELHNPHPFAHHTALRELLRIRGGKTHWILKDAITYQFDTEEETQEFHKAIYKALKNEE